MISIQQKIYTHLIDLIERGELLPEARMPAESELCDLFQASRNTVRKAYDELVHKGYVVRKPGLGSFVSDTIKVHNFSIGVIVPGNDVFDKSVDPVAGALKYDVFNGILDRAHEIGAKVNLVPANEAWRSDNTYDGYILLYSDDNIKKQFELNGTPCVSSVLGSYETGFPSVFIDLQASFRSCFEYLISTGHKKIGLVDSTHPVLSAYSAYEKVLNKHSLHFDESYVVRFDHTLPAEGRKSFIKLMETNHDLDALFFRTDITAIDALCYCQEKDIKIPGALSIMGFDNIPDSEHTSPPLTTFDTRRSERGYTATKMLESLRQNPNASMTDICLPGKIIERQTVKNPKG